MGLRAWYGRVRRTVVDALNDSPSPDRCPFRYPDPDAVVIDGFVSTLRCQRARGHLWKCGGPDGSYAPRYPWESHDDAR